MSVVVLLFAQANKFSANANIYSSQTVECLKTWKPTRSADSAGSDLETFVCGLCRLLVLKIALRSEIWPFMTRDRGQSAYTKWLVMWYGVVRILQKLIWVHSKDEYCLLLILNISWPCCDAALWEENQQVMWIYYIILVNVVNSYMFRLLFVAIFREAFYQMVYYEDKQSNLQL